MCGCEDGRGDKVDRRRDPEGGTEEGRERAGGEDGSRAALRIEEGEGGECGGCGEGAEEMTFTGDDMVTASVKVGRFCLVWVACMCFVSMIALVVKSSFRLTL